MAVPASRSLALLLLLPADLVAVLLWDLVAGLFVGALALLHLHGLGALLELVDLLVLVYLKCRQGTNVVRHISRLDTVIPLTK